jgi:hypothetical protein
MAVIHNTTMSPSKLELLTSWLPAQPWYVDSGRAPELAKVGGFRLDDPEDEVGIEFMVITDRSGQLPTTYHVPLTYRASAREGADDGLIGTAEHGVLGRRWIYDGTHDPVLVTQLVALIQGDADAQAQSDSDTPDLTVVTQPMTTDHLTAVESAVVANESCGTDLRVEAAGSDGARTGHLVARINRVLQRHDGAVPVGGPGRGYVAAPWRLPDGTHVRGIFATCTDAHHAHQQEGIA